MSSQTRYSFSKQHLRVWLIDGIFLTISSLLTAIAVRFFFTEYALTPGGITGLSIVLHKMTGISVEMMSLLISIPLLIIATLFLGGKFGMKTLYVVFAIPFFLNIIPQIHSTNSILVASILGGFLVGIAIALACWRKCATGGTDTLAMIIQRVLQKIKLPVIIFVLDISIVCSSLLISKQWITSVYSAIALVVIVGTINEMMKILPTKGE